MYNLLMRSNLRNRIATAYRYLYLSSGQQQNIMSIRKLLSRCGVIVLLCLLLNLVASLPVHAADPAQQLRKSFAAMKSLKAFSFHTDLSGNSTQLDSKGKPSLTSITLTADGIWVRPDRVQSRLSLKADPPAQNLTLTEIMAGKNLYVQGPQGEWYILNQPSLGAFGSPFFGTSLMDDNKLSEILSQANIKDSSLAVLKGVSTRHFVITINKAALKALLNQSTQSLQDATVKKATIDVWIDRATDYLQQFQLQFELIEPAGTSAKGATQTNRVNLTIGYNRFNDGTLKVIVPAKVSSLPTGPRDSR